jgi:hypothetical protein
MLRYGHNGGLSSQIREGEVGRPPDKARNH